MEGRNVSVMVYNKKLEDNVLPRKEGLEGRTQRGGKQNCWQKGRIQRQTCFKISKGTKSRIPDQRRLKKYAHH
jgi:hypothetical protein